MGRLGRVYKSHEDHGSHWGRLDLYFGGNLFLRAICMKHLAIILDGNRRWAKEHGLPSLEGHRKGYENVKTIGLAALERGIEHFSVFAFSTENWKRSQEEVGYLMELLFLALTKELDFFWSRMFV